jgi:hypothetical protein
MPISDPSLPLQKIFVVALKAAVVELDGRVYDEVPAGAKYPYVTIGNTQILSEKTECLEGAEVYQTIDVWTQSAGRVEAKRIGAAVISALDDAALSDGTLTINSCNLEDAQYLDDPDGITKHGVLTFHILTD